MTKKIQCRDCSCVFSFTDKQQARYRMRGWKDPVRCDDCAMEYEARYAGWQSTMGDRLHRGRGNRQPVSLRYTFNGFRREG